MPGPTVGAVTSRRVAPCLLALVALAGCGSGTTTGSGGCAGPAITLSSPSVTPGSDLGLTAEHVRAGNTLSSRSSVSRMAQA